MRSRLLAALVLPLALTACNSAGPFVDEAPVRTDAVTLTADQARYDRGDSARLTLSNQGTATLTMGVLECAQLERWTGSAWETSPEGNDRACILIAVYVEPGQTQTGEVPLDVRPGSYRLVQSGGVEDAEAGFTVATASFRVE